MKFNKHMIKYILISYLILLLIVLIYLNFNLTYLEIILLGIISFLFIFIIPICLS